MTTEAALPNAEQATASPTDTAALEAARAIDNDVNAGELTPEQQAEAAKADESAKPEKTPEERERQRMQRGIDRRTKQLAEARAEAEYLRQQLTQGAKQTNNQQTADDSEPLSLTRAQLQELVKAEASKLAPTLREEAAEAERRQGVIQSLAKTWGQERFDEVASDLDDAFGGLADRSGKPKPAIEAVFEADDPAKVIEFLIDPDNLDESDRISKMSAAQAGKAIAKLEARLKTEPAKDKPQVSKAAAPLEAIRGTPPAAKDPATMSDKEFAQWRRNQIAQRH